MGRVQTGLTAMRRGFAAVLLGCCLLGTGPAVAQAVPAAIVTPSLPAFAWSQPGSDGLNPRPWEGSYARIASGFEVTSSKHYGTTAGPTLGFEGGRMWQDGNFVYGIVGGFDAFTPVGSSVTPRFGSLTYTRDFAGVLQLKAGALLADNVLLYTKVGGALVNETWRFGATRATPTFQRSDIALRPDARVGVEWAVTDRITVGIEAGVTGAGLR